MTPVRTHPRVFLAEYYIARDRTYHNHLIPKLGTKAVCGRALKNHAAKWTFAAVHGLFGINLCPDCKAKAL